MSSVKDKAKRLGATELGISTRATKRFYVLYQGKVIHFGARGGSTFLDHGDPVKRDAWRARHSKIVSADGTPFYMIKTSPEYWAWHLLW